MFGGALIGLVVGLIVIGVMLIVASKKQPSWEAATRRSADFSIEMEPAAAIARLKGAAPAAGLAIALDEDGSDRLILNDKVSAFSFGYFVPVNAVADGAGSKVTVGLTTKVPQWGPVVTNKHRAIVNKVKAALGAAA